LWPTLYRKKKSESSRQNSKRTKNIGEANYALEIMRQLNASGIPRSGEGENDVGSDFRKYFKKKAPKHSKTSSPLLSCFLVFPVFLIKLFILNSDFWIFPS